MFHFYKWVNENSYFAYACRFPFADIFLLFSPDGGFPGLRVEDLADAEGSGGSSEEQDHAREGVQRAPSATDGAVDNPSVELDAFLQENESGGNEGSPYCDVDGKQVHKQRVLTELMGSQFGSASRDRLKRVRGPPSGRSSVSDLPGVGAGDAQCSGIGNTNARSLGVGDPFAMMVATRPGQYTLGLFSCTSAPREESREGTGEVIKGRLMKLRRTRSTLEVGEEASTPGAVAATSNAPVEDMWSHWGELGMHKGELSCKCRLVLPLNPDVVHEPVVVKETVTRTVLGTGPMTQETVEVEKVSARTAFQFSRSDLVAVKALLVEEVGTLKAWRHLPLQKIARADVNPLPIHEDLFHFEADAVGATPAAGSGTEKIWCKVCLAQVPRSKMRMHVGGHILKDKVRCHGL